MSTTSIHLSIYCKHCINDMALCVCMITSSIQFLLLDNSLEFYTKPYQTLPPVYLGNTALQIKLALAT